MEFKVQKAVHCARESVNVYFKGEKGKAEQLIQVELFKFFSPPAHFKNPR